MRIAWLTIGTNEDGRLELFVSQGYGGKGIWHRWEFPFSQVGEWTEWNFFGGDEEYYNLSVINNQDGRLELFATGHSGLSHKWQFTPNGNWTSFDSLGNQVDRIALGRNADGRLEVFGINQYWHVIHIWQLAPNSNWGEWYDLPGERNFSGAPMAVGSNKDGSLELFALSKDDYSLYHCWQASPSGMFSGWVKFSEKINSSLYGMVVESNLDGRLEVFVEHRGEVLHKAQTIQNNGWGNWSSLGFPGGNFLAGGLFSIKNKDGSIALFTVTLNDGALYYNTQISPNGTWSGWMSLKGRHFRRAIAGLDRNGTLQVFALGSDGIIYHKRQKFPFATPTEWTDWTSFGSPFGAQPDNWLSDHHEEDDTGGSVDGGDTSTPPQKPMRIELLPQSMGTEGGLRPYSYNNELGNFKLEQIELPTNGGNNWLSAIKFPRPGYSTDYCDSDDSKYVILRVGQKTSPDQLKAIYGSESPVFTPNSKIFACASPKPLIENGQIVGYMGNENSSIGILITYTTL
jgi:hypothetical protein